MKFIIQRVTQAKCEVDKVVTGQIQKGFCVLIGISETDNEQIADKMMKKLLGMRIFSDANGKTNLSLQDVDGELLLISQFTLYADCRKGNRPSFVHAGNPELAKRLYEYIINQCKLQVPVVQTGIFGADMRITLTNEGPFTIVLDSEELNL
ncbi:MAG: D-aminoacyl-tRNA deacylase [Lachnospiraceae bacterium]|nr:D-aminoacyl-tRNA deacylase [Lachnospiraceae bacterium]